jgi:abortive infection bacteriophage resistance protein
MKNYDYDFAIVHSMQHNILIIKNELSAHTKRIECTPTILPNDGSQLQKHVAGKFVCIYLIWFFNKKQIMMIS